MFTLKVIGVMLTGVLLGYACRKFRGMACLEKSIFATVLLLLFWMGVEVGNNPHVTRNLFSLGGQALLLSLAGMLGSVLAAGFVYRCFFQKSVSEEPGPVLETGTTFERKGVAEPCTGKRERDSISGESPKKKSGAWKSTCLTLGAFAAGCILGYLLSLPDSLMQQDVSLYILYALMLQVGASMGADSKTKEAIRQIRPKLLLVPLATWVGTLSFCALVSFLLPRWNLWESMAVGSGFAYYSLSSILITEIKTPLIGLTAATELGVIALMANISREIFTIVGAPFLARCFGKLAPICAGGATTLDTTLPAITQACGKEWVFVSMFHAVLVDLSVPFLVSFFCSL